MQRSSTTVRAFAHAALIAMLATTMLVTSGCGSSSKPQTTETATPQAEPIAIRIGTLPTEDALPLWVAESEGLFEKAGLPKVEITVFQAAQERDAAMASGAIDAFMGDTIAAANLEAGGTPVTIGTIMLGATPAEGRFGIVGAKDWTGGTGNEGLAKLASVPVGTSSATIQEYVLDRLMTAAGVPAGQVKVEEVKKVPVRFELLMQGKLKAAALPEPFLSLAELQGAKLIADDTTGDNITQTVLVLSDEFLSKTGGIEAEEALLKAWDEAVAKINADPNAYRAMLVDKARLPEPLKDSYKIDSYPTAQLPTRAQVDSVLSWMREKGYLKSDTVDYTHLTIVLPSK